LVYADANFFLALLKEKDRLKEKALKLLEEYRGNMKTSLTTFIELMLLSKRYGLDPVRVTLSVMELNPNESFHSSLRDRLVRLRRSTKAVNRSVRTMMYSIALVLW